MSKQLGFWSVEDRLKELSAQGDPLEKLLALVDFELFRPVLDEALDTVDRSKGGRPLSEPGATYSGVSAYLGITPTQLKTWRLELAELRRDNKRLKEEVEVLRKASAFFAQWATKT